MIAIPERPIRQFDKLVREGHLLPIHQYDKIIVSYSGGKDSTALVVEMLDWACGEQDYPKSQIELWHQDVDGGAALMDWPCTRGYCKAVAKALHLPIRFQWKDRGFEGELLRENEKTKGVYFEDGARQVQYLPPAGGKLATRRKFPAKTANLQTRWCSGYLKIDVARRAMNNDPRFARGNYLFLTGERRQESAARAKYNEVEVYNRNRNRRADQWRCVIDWDEQFIWEAFEKYAIVPHPAYRIGFSRVSCMACIFGNKDQWASVRELAPKTFQRLADYEEVFGHTIDNTLSVIQMADRGQSFVANAPKDLLDLAMSHNYPEDQVFADRWELPVGAFGQQGGPS